MRAELNRGNKHKMQLKKIIVPGFRCHFRSILSGSHLECMAGTTGLEPATSAVTGQRSDQLSYVPRLFFNNLVIRHIESSASQLSLFSLFSTISLLWTQFRASVDTTWTPRWTPNQVNATTESSLPDTFCFLVSTIPSSPEFSGFKS